ncbi:hypothetical protein GCM10010082_06060 [Kushneria pakistanensis]|uniref:Uracil-DNA glycosylase-like domain-containing protein n=1 Tax=Kushneria pakistanensis TaxID=1508770 RepID=A0ABQ3FBS6_9GAMM|nr:hypothetical protein [Kushneria pakistanensis]GHC17596.1 hypothetical protein GCM10010082_06060 [Kushneria pakistanensis]
MEDQLISRYRDILLDTDFTSLEAEKANYAGVFLPVPSPAFGQSGFKLMVVGQETRSWNGSLEKLLKAITDQTLSEYLTDATGKYLAQLETPLQSAFRSFLTGSEKRLGMIASEIYWANLLACSYRKASPRGRPKAEYETLRALSSQLLATQIRLLKPDAILFLTGPNHDKTIKAMSEEHFAGYQHSQVEVPRQLWFFQMNGIPCCRTTHPRYRAGYKYCIDAIETIAQFKETASGPMSMPAS